MILQLTVPFISFSRHVQLQTVTSLTTHARSAFTVTFTLCARSVTFTSRDRCERSSTVRLTVSHLKVAPSFHNSLLCDLVSGHVQVSNWCIDSQPHVMEYVSLKLNSTTRTRHGNDRTRTDPHGLFLRRNSVGSVRVRSGPCSGI